jgi:hypothetical protein
MKVPLKLLIIWYNTRAPRTLISATTFLRDHVAKNDISLEGVRSENQLADIFTKPLDEATFCRLRSELNVLDSSNFKK